MDFAGFTLEAYIAVAVFLSISGAIIFALVKTKLGSTPRRTALLSLIPTILIASAIGMLFIPSTHMYATEGKVITAEPHGDGSNNSDYTTLDLDQTNAGLVVMRSEMPAVSEGDTVRLRCKTAGADEVYICTGSVSSGNTGE